MLYVRQDSEAWSMWSATAHCVPYCPDKFSRLPLCSKDSVLLFSLGLFGRAGPPSLSYPAICITKLPTLSYCTSCWGFHPLTSPLTPGCITPTWHCLLGTMSRTDLFHWSHFTGTIPWTVQTLCSFYRNCHFFHMAPIPSSANKGWMGLLRFFSFLLCNCLLVW